MSRPTPLTPGPVRNRYGYHPPAAGEADRRRAVCAGRTVVDTTDAVRVLDTSHPPTWYMPVAALRGAHLAMIARSAWCEFNGKASYADIVGPDRTVLAPGAEWLYRQPARGFEQLDGRFPVHPHRVDRCLVDEEQVRGQAGVFHGGWVTNDVLDFSRVNTEP